MEIGKRLAEKRMGNTADLRKGYSVYNGMASTLYCEGKHDNNVYQVLRSIYTYLYCALPFSEGSSCEQFYECSRCFVVCHPRTGLFYKNKNVYALSHEGSENGLHSGIYLAE